MAGEWPTATIEELAEKVAMGPFGSSIKVSTFVPNGIPVISGQHLHGVRLKDSDYNFVTEDHAECLRNANVQRGDVVFTHAGNIGQVAFIPEASRYKRYVLSQRQFYLRCDRTKLLPEFIAYYFHSPEGQHKLMANASQTGVPSLARPVSYLRTIDVPVPPLPTQCAITHILGTLDDKIELNRKMNETLEALARAIFDQFFPYSPEDNLPEGWRVTAFSEIVEIMGGGTPKTSISDYWNGDIPWFSVVDTPSDSNIFVLDTEKHISEAGIENSSTRVLPIGTTIVTARGTVGKLAFVGAPMAMNQSCYGLRGKSDKAGYFTYFMARQIVGQLQQHAHGSVFDTITRNTLAGIDIVNPSDDALRDFTLKVELIMISIRNNLEQSRTLAALRDALLPKLLSGQIRVPSATNLVEAMT